MSLFAVAGLIANQEPEACAAERRATELPKRRVQQVQSQKLLNSRHGEPQIKTLYEQQITRQKPKTIKSISTLQDLGNDLRS